MIDDMVDISQHPITNWHKKIRLSNANCARNEKILNEQYKNNINNNNGDKQNINT